jgi:hypothetical protein
MQSNAPQQRRAMLRTECFELPVQRYSVSVALARVATLSAGIPLAPRREHSTDPVHRAKLRVAEGPRVRRLTRMTPIPWATRSPAAERRMGAYASPTRRLTTRSSHASELNTVGVH